MDLTYLFKKNLKIILMINMRYLTYYNDSLLIEIKDMFCALTNSLKSLYGQILGYLARGQYYQKIKINF